MNNRVPKRIGKMDNYRTRLQPTKESRGPDLSEHVFGRNRWRFSRIPSSGANIASHQDNILDRIQ
jgi:hypothetical protein